MCTGQSDTFQSFPALLMQIFSGEANRRKDCWHLVLTVMFCGCLLSTVPIVPINGSLGFGAALILSVLLHGNCIVMFHLCIDAKPSHHDD